MMNYNMSWGEDVPVAKRILTVMVNGFFKSTEGVTGDRLIPWEGSRIVKTCQIDNFYGCTDCQRMALCTRQSFPSKRNR